MIEYVAPIISGLALIVSFLMWKDKKVAMHRATIEELEDRVRDLENRLSILEERVGNQIKALDHLDDKMDELWREL